ncbi:MAG TPA: S53 family peptidase [Ktedonobacteraceae bacterium]|nr:S53 family peptidase [Ktedonobacteraceae bacterium]
MTFTTRWRRTATSVTSTLIMLLLLLTACGIPGGIGINGGTPTATSHTTTTATQPDNLQTDTCPQLRGYPDTGVYCYTPHQFRVAYGVEALTKKGFTGKGQTVVDIVSFGSPTLQQDLDVFNKQFGLPPIKIQIINPLGTKTFDPNNKDMAGWAGETTLDVQIIHAIAPDAGIVVLTSPVSETEGTIGLPEFRQLEQYAIDHQLGSIISQSWGASEVTLKDAAGKHEIQKWNAFFQKATTQQGMTFFASSGDNGATDYIDLQATKLSPSATTSFPADEPWVTSVGGTTAIRNGTTVEEKVWNSGGGGSGGGFSDFFTTPSFQSTLPSSVQSQLQNRRGVPDVAGAADPLTGVAFYQDGVWGLTGGTSASAPLWAALIAIANQMAGHPLGFINPALYKLALTSHYGQDFHDITNGNNNVNYKGVTVEGYQAVQGWDPATGLGTPNAEKLLPDLIATMKQ